MSARPRKRGRRGGGGSGFQEQQQQQAPSITKEELLAKTVAGPIDLPGGLVVARRRRAIRIAQNDTMGRT